MKKDIEFLKVENIAVAVVPDVQSEEMNLFSTYLLNFKEMSLQNVFIRSQGKGQINEEKVETSTLRILIENIAPQSFVKVDDFPEQAIGLSNEYWVSFKQNGYLYDKRFIFVPESIVESNYTEIPLIGKRGVMIR